MLSGWMMESVAVARSSKRRQFGFDVAVGVAEIPREQARWLNGRGNDRPVGSGSKSGIDAAAVATAARFVHIGRFFRQRDQRQIPQCGVVAVLFRGDPHQRLPHRSCKDRRHDAGWDRGGGHRTVADVQWSVSAAAPTLTGIRKRWWCRRWSWFHRRRNIGSTAQPVHLVVLLFRTDHRLLLNELLDLLLDSAIQDTVGLPAGQHQDRRAGRTLFQQLLTLLWKQRGWIFSWMESMTVSRWLTSDCWLRLVLSSTWAASARHDGDFMSIRPTDTFNLKSQWVLAVRTSHSATHRKAWMMDPVTVKHSNKQNINLLSFLLFGNVCDLPAGSRIGCGLNLYNRLRSCRIGAAQAAQASSVARAANCNGSDSNWMFCETEASS